MNEPIKCLNCGYDDLDGEFFDEPWYECPNCDMKPSTSIYIDKLKKYIEKLEEWARVSILVAQIHAFSGIEDDSWKRVNWEKYLPSGQSDVWQTFDEETKAKLDIQTP